jgi:hypothetical protein
MAKIYDLSDHPKRPKSLQDLYDRFLIPARNDTLLAFIFEGSKLMHPVVDGLAWRDVHRLSDLLRFTEEEFFERFSFKPRERKIFSTRVARAGGRFGEPKT